MTIAIDINDVIRDFTRQFIKYYQKVIDPSFEIEYDDVNDFEFTNIFPFLDENGNVVKMFPSIGMACKFCNTKGHSQLYDAIRNDKQYKGYYWTCERELFK